MKNVSMLSVIALATLSLSVEAAADEGPVAFQEATWETMFGDAYTNSGEQRWELGTSLPEEVGVYDAHNSEGVPYTLQIERISEDVDLLEVGTASHQAIRNALNYDVQQRSLDGLFLLENGETLPFHGVAFSAFDPETELTKTTLMPITEEWDVYPEASVDEGEGFLAMAGMPGDAAETSDDTPWWHDAPCPDVDVADVCSEGETFDEQCQARACRNYKRKFKNAAQQLVDTVDEINADASAERLECRAILKGTLVQNVGDLIGSILTVTAWGWSQFIERQREYNACLRTANTRAKERHEEAETRFADKVELAEEDYRNDLEECCVGDDCVTPDNASPDLVDF
ncbi:MAG: hypothetical protein ACON4N_08170 [Myxococcota bacterium]